MSCLASKESNPGPAVPVCASFAPVDLFSVARSLTSEMPFAYYARLSAARKRIYERSDAIGTLGLPPGTTLGGEVRSLRAALLAENRMAAQAACQRIADTLTHGSQVPPLRIRVLAQRPSDDFGELHGLYEPEEGRTPSRITIWMRTAHKQHVVAFKSFLRTLCHEICHHLDYELFALQETFHTEGFYKRESAITTALLAQEAAHADLG